MLKDVLQRTAIAIGVTILAAGMVMISQSAANAGPATIDGKDGSVDSLHGTWSCTVPSGYVYSSVQHASSCPWGYRYLLMDPVAYDLTGQYACSVPSGFTYSYVQITNNCAASGSSYQYRLLDPVRHNLTGQYACSVPPGYTYSASRVGNNCSEPGSSYEYRLVRS